MMQSVAKADVVITNPTHLAVALRYQSSEMNAPQVVAKGAERIAEKIRELARKNGVPIVENKALAQSLYATVDLGHEVPGTLYQAVAEILAYVYRLKGRGISAG
jgi:flagellar biosynthetic protein FlhB